MAAISGSSVNTEAPAPLASGLRAFFLLGSIHAAVVMVLWVPWFLGLVGLSSAFTPRVWHTYELLFGSFLAIVAGTLTTVMPGRARQGPMNGWLLAVLVALWLIARLAIGISGQLDERLTAAACLPFSVALACLIGRECIATRDWRDLGLAATLVGLAIAEALFHYEA